MQSSTSIINDYKLLTFNQDLFKYILPSGVQRNSLIILTGEGGSGKSVILIHLVKDVLTRGEPVIYVALDDDPQTVLSQLESFGLKTSDYCRDKRLLIIDGFSYLIKQRKPQYCVEEEINPENPDTILTALGRVIEKYGIQNSGIVVIDSLNEPMLFLDPTRLVIYIKSLRANIAKSRNILTLATLHTSTNSYKEYLLTIEHIVDGILETSSIPSEIAQQIPFFVRQISVRKIKGVSSRPGWVLYGIDNEGLKPIVLRIKS
ncbi:MAG: ATPase domain-containing protein [Desulfurococcaceae archaeon]